MRILTILFLTILLVLPVGMISMGSQAELVSDDITLPTLEENDSWSMGFFEDITDMLFGGSEFGDFGDYSDLLGASGYDLDGSIGFYQTLTVVDADDMSTGVECYKMKLEQYMGVVVNIDIDVETVTDYFEMIMDLSGYIWLEMDITGFVYFTVDELAIAREEIVVDADADIDLHMYMKEVIESFDYYAVEDSSTSSGGNSTDVYYGEPVPVDDTYPDDSINIEIDVDMTLTITDLHLDYDIDYEPPLDIFDFPIEPYEDWTASSDMTVTLNDLSGTIVYDISGDVPDEDFMTESGSVELGSDTSFPETYGPVSVYYSFSNQGMETIGDFGRCVMIEGEEDSYFNYDYGYSYETSSGTSPFDVTEKPSSSSIMSEFDDFGAEEAGDLNPIGSIITGINYYSPEEGMIVQSDLSDSPMGSLASEFDSGMEMGDMMPGSMSDMTMEPVTKAEVQDFKDVQRPEQKNQYNEFKKGEVAEPEGKFVGSTSFWLIIIAVIIVVVLIAAAGIIASKRKRKPGTGYEQTQPQTTQAAPAYQQYNNSPPPPPPSPPDSGNFYPPPPPPPPPNY